MLSEPWCYIAEPPFVELCAVPRCQLPSFAEGAAGATTVDSEGDGLTPVAPEPSNQDPGDTAIIVLATCLAVVIALLLAGAAFGAYRWACRARACCCVRWLRINLKRLSSTSPPSSQETPSAPSQPSVRMGRAQSALAAADARAVLRRTGTAGASAPALLLRAAPKPVRSSARRDHAWPEAAAQPRTANHSAETNNVSTGASDPSHLERFATAAQSSAELFSPPPRAGLDGREYACGSDDGLQSLQIAAAGPSGASAYTPRIPAALSPRAALLGPGGAHAAHQRKVFDFERSACPRAWAQRDAPPGLLRLLQQHGPHGRHARTISSTGGSLRQHSAVSSNALHTVAAVLAPQATLASSAPRGSELPVAECSASVADSMPSEAMWSERTGMWHQAVNAQLAAHAGAPAAGAVSPVLRPIEAKPRASSSSWGSPGDTRSHLGLGHRGRSQRQGWHSRHSSSPMYAPCGPPITLGHTQSSGVMYRHPALTLAHPMQAAA